MQRPRCSRGLGSARKNSLKVTSLELNSHLSSLFRLFVSFLVKKRCASCTASSCLLAWLLPRTTVLPIRLASLAFPSLSVVGAVRTLYTRETSLVLNVLDLIRMVRLLLRAMEFTAPTNVFRGTSATRLPSRVILANQAKETLKHNVRQSV
jgi:hypothetical protein